MKTGCIVVNAIPLTRKEAGREVVIYSKVQKFWNSGGEFAVIGGLTFTRFTASRHLSLNSAPVARYLEGLAVEKADALRKKGILESKEHQ